jgi:hypothetical protein
MIGGEGRLMTALVSLGPETRLAPRKPDTLFVKEDWVLFRNLDTLGQKAGVPEGDIPKLVAKELVDNALDAAGSCRIELTDQNGFRVSDQGDGIPGDDAEVAALFSINRPLTSSKLLRRPTRGALGNGLRVVTGAVVATGGSLLVSTRGRSLRLIHDHDSGNTLAENLGTWNEVGTQVKATFGDRFSIYESTLDWAEKAILLSGRKSYTGKSSPFWYDCDAFYELLQAAKGRRLRDLVASLEGYNDRAAGQVLRGQGYNGEMCRDLDKQNSSSLLEALRSGIGKSVTPGQLGEIGPLDPFPNHARFEDIVELGENGARRTRLPVAVEAWGRPTHGSFGITAFVNRTPITGDIGLWKSDKDMVVRGCGLWYSFSGNHRPFELWFNVDTPYMPITTEGKAPNFSSFSEPIKKACQKAAKKIPRERERPRQVQLTQQDLIFRLIPECVSHASGGNKHRFQQRQLFYVVRPRFADHFGFAPEYNYFCKVVTEYENQRGDIQGMYRDPRGSVYHPHEREDIPLGTLNVEDYQRPEWLFNKVLYIEKEGFFPILRDAEWPERNDCALLTSKGQGTRAAKDLIDRLAETEQACEFFMIHDADAAGTMIYQCLQEETAARGARNVTIINLGLEPSEGRDMGLYVEDVEYGKRHAVADYVPAADKTWLQTHRIELNAMTSPQFLAWLDEKFASHAKLIPPAEALKDHLEGDVRKALQKKIIERVLKEAGIDEQVDKAVEELKSTIDERVDDLVDEVTMALDDDRSQRWTAPINQIALDLVS